MVQRVAWRVGLGAVLAVSWATMASTAEISELLQTIKSVGPEGKNNVEAAKAWKELATSRAAALPTILTAFDDANPLAANYLRSAVETIAQRELQQKRPLPVAEVEKFLKDTQHNARARRLAFELLARVDATAPDRLIPGMVSDPSVELRRDAVQRLMTQANEQFDKGKKDDATPIYAQAMAAARDDDQIRILKKRLEELGEKVDLPRHFGFLMTWRLVAPFDNTGMKGFNVVYPPEKQLDFNAEYEGKDGMKIRWTSHTTDNEYGKVNLAKALAPYKGAVTYAAAEFISDKEQTVDFRLGTPNSWKIWLNGELLFAREEYHQGQALDQFTMRGSLKAGKNIVLVKVLQNEQKEDWAQDYVFQLRVCDATGTAVLSADRATAQARLGENPK